jgi:hypothetical protein
MPGSLKARVIPGPVGRVFIFVLGTLLLGCAAAGLLLAPLTLESIGLSAIIGWLGLDCLVAALRGRMPVTPAL